MNTETNFQLLNFSWYVWPCVTTKHYQVNVICNSIQKNTKLPIILSLAMSRRLLGGSSNRFQGTEMVIDPFPIEIFNISSTATIFVMKPWQY